jgi:hypothetical protein
MVTIRNMDLSLFVLGILLSGMFVVKRHESFYGEKTNTEMLTRGNNVVAKDIFINVRAGWIILFKFLNNSVVDDITGLLDGFGIKTLRGTDNDVCQKSTALIHNDE